MRLNNDIFSTRNGGIVSSTKPDYVLIYDTESPKVGYHLFPCISQSIKREDEMQVLKYPTPNGDYTGRKVIIENQLEETDHDHLGKLITYASGKGAEVVVWVVKRARDEHRQAIEWLNQHTDTDLGFFLVEIELWQIDDSAIAPKFSVIERPNDWGKQMKSVAGLNNTEQIQLAFWQKFNDKMNASPDFTKHFKTRKAQPQNWYDISVGSSEYHLCFTASIQKKHMSCGIYIPDNKELFHLFEAHKADFEAQFGKDIEWGEATKATRINIFKPFDVSDQEQWGTAYTWYLENAIKFKLIPKSFQDNRKVLRNLGVKLNYY